jgi:hypothetical protein
MVGGSQHARFTGPALVRLLARLAEVDAPASKHGVPERLGQWLGWADAIALSAALNGHAPKAHDVAPSAGRPLAPGTAQAEVARVRTALTKAIEQDTAAPPREALIAPETGFAPFRRAYAAKQQTMELATGTLRSQLRETLTRTSPALARLAAVDAVMEQVVGAQERQLLWRVPSLLERHFERLRDAAGTDPHETWMRRFCREQQAVLLAELDLRLQPAEGLLEALRDD